MSQTATRVKPAPPAAPKKPEPTERRHESGRETVESIVVAFILALFIRGFEAEAFVIPTGSMAPTLMGRHKEIVCPQCGQVYAVNASDETELAFDRDHDRRVEWGTCVNCRFQARLNEAPSFKGDRILVMKFLYDLPFLPGAARPRRWDVVVFKYPEQPETNYIKRLIGLPGDVVQVFGGNIYTKPMDGPEGTRFKLARKPLNHQQAMQILVYDDSNRPKALADDPAWLRWKTAGIWGEETAGVFRTSKAAAAGTAGESGWSELRYSHLVPEPEQWTAILSGQTSRPPRPTLVTDFYSYNTNITADSGGYESGSLQPHWVGDLTLSGQLEVTSPTGLVRFELIKGGVANRCEINVGTGMASLFHGEKLLGEAMTAVKQPGKYDFGFANVDDRLTLWVDGRTPFGQGLEYDDGPTVPHPSPTNADLQPAAVAVRGADAKVSGLVLKRDIYYTQEPGKPDYDIPWDRYSADVGERTHQLYDLLADPAQYAALVVHQPRDYPIHPGKYMMMGDNSPRSKDGRGWENGDRAWDRSGRESWEVPEALLIGKAFFVYWPHGKPFGPDIKLTRDFRIPFRPYFERMKWIR